MEDILSEELFVDGTSLVMEEEIEGGKKQICFKGVFSEADKMNRNHRIYPKSVLREACQNAINEWKKTGQPIIGEIEHPSSSRINLERIAVTFKDLCWNEEAGQLTGKAVPTKTPSGDIIKGLAESGLPICFSTRCSGSVKPYKGPLAEGVSNAVEVNPGLKLIAIDVVSTPSCQKAVSQTVEEGYTENNTMSFKSVFDSCF